MAHIGVATRLVNERQCGQETANADLECSSSRYYVLIREAESYAKKHRIARTYDGTNCYESLLKDSEVDAVYIVLPNGLHHSWALRALIHGKHVLVEKPMANTAEECRELISLAESKGLVLLEAIHYTCCLHPSRFHPALQRFKEIVAGGELGAIKRVKAGFAVPSVISGLFFLKDDVRFDFSLGGGVMMDMGVYSLSAIRYVTSNNPVKVGEATAVGHPADSPNIDKSMNAHLVLPSSVSGDLYVDFSMPGWGPFGMIPRALETAVVVELEEGTVELTNFPLPHIFNTITIRPKIGKKRNESVYRFKDGRGEEWWTTYRYQLEAFVDRVQGRSPQTWPSNDEPAIQMEWVDEIYRAAGMPRRPNSVPIAPSN
ncbi:hypothetical protein PLEOSDRAFT_23216 [Pleurotus ostreatus PC15]|uniref:D-xylose 1-dehydrogenase (NADP(+), D-xylono-1,5-lactone-forming) n=1 Tax=Pleurotus ostreatus (strain PC15) TaxID=1137138 RepID=A0A067NVK8_PLEO1|nr:hypothetical protein PLEOSDRAFT_23216 [Pleurotus ostreatus PC15]